MRMNRLSLLGSPVFLFLALGVSAVPATAQQVDNLNISFNGPKDQFPYTDQFFAATISYYQNVLGRSSMPGNRHCHVYLSWDLGNQAAGSGPVGTEGSRAWFENYLAAAQGHCDRVLVSFKNIAGVTQTSPNGYPTIAQYQPAVTAFLNTNWSYAGWTNGSTAFDYTSWNEPNIASSGGDGYTNGTQVGAERAAEYYLVLRAACTNTNCGQVAAGDFGSNGSTAYLDFIQNCTNDVGTLCGNASYMDTYKHYLAADTTTYGLASNFRPEIFSYHGWDDINNYINSSYKCTDSKCTIKDFTTALSDSGWTGSALWDTEVAAGQNPESNPSAGLQACAAAWLLNLTSSTTTRFARIYWTQPYDSSGEYWSIFTSSGGLKPAFTVLADRETSYSGQTCP